MPDPSTLSVIEHFLHILNDMSPAALAALVTILLLAIVHKNGPIRQMQNNHLVHIQASLDKMVENTATTNTKLDEQTERLGRIHDDMQWVKAKVD